MWRSVTRRLVIPCVSVALAVVLEAVLQTRLHQLVLTPSLAAVVICVLYGGMTAGILATILSIVLMDVLFLDPDLSSRAAAIEDILQLTIFMMVAVVVSSLSKEKLARIKAEARSRAKDELLREVAHELRTPMSSILGWTEVLRRRPEGKGLQEVCDVIERNAKMQILLVDDLLDVARMLTGKLKLATNAVDLRKVIDAAVGIVLPTATAKQIRLVTSAPGIHAQLHVRGDERRLLQVLWNVLTNAIKFTPANGLVAIEAKVVNQLAVVEVIDNGKGMKPEQLASIFEKGIQGKDAEHAGGLGFGLWIARSIVELHDGTIAVSSVEGRGSTFSIKLPLMEHVPPSGALEHHRALQAT